MIQEIRNIFEQVILAPKDLIRIVGISKLKNYKKGTTIIHVGEYNYTVIAIIKGLLRHYCIDDQGSERTKLFVPERNITGSLETMFYEKPSFEYIETLEDSTINTSSS